MINPSKRGKRGFVLIVLMVFLGGLSSVLMYWITSCGPGVSPDSTMFIEAARSVHSGDGFYIHGKPVTLTPPVYTFLISIAGLFSNGDMLRAARLVGILFFGANIVLLGLSVDIMTKKSLSATACAILFFLSSAQVILMHSMAFSETPFITFSISSLILLSFYINRPSLYLLFLSACMAGLATTTRYAGLALLPPMAFILLFFGKRPASQRGRDLLLLCAVVFIPLTIWAIRNLVVAKTATGRILTFHPFGIPHVKALVVTVNDLLLNVHTPFWGEALILILIVALILMALGNLARKEVLSENIATIEMLAKTSQWCFGYLKF